MSRLDPQLLRQGCSRVPGHSYISQGGSGRRLSGSLRGREARHARLLIGRHQVGVIDEVVDNYRERILDGFVIEDASGELRFVDAPEVARTADRAVRLTIDSAAAAQLPPPEKGALSSARGAAGASAS